MSDLSNLGLDPNVEESGPGYTVIEPGRYKAVITGDKLAPTKDGTGRMLGLKVQIIEGKFAGEVVQDRLNVINKSAQAQAIGQGQLKRICGLCGVPFPPADSTALYGKPLMVQIINEPFTSNKTGEVLLSNKIKNYGPVVEALPVKQAAAGGW